MLEKDIVAKIRNYLKTVPNCFFWECWFFGDMSPGMEQEMQEAKRLRKKIRRFDQQMMEVSS